MRAMLLVLLFFLGALAQERCSLRGLAFDSATRQPLGGVHIRLIPSPFFGVQAYGALSDESGHFSIVPIPPGSYFVDAEYPGFSYVPVPKNGRTMPTLVIQAGQQLDDFPIQMAAHAIISGRVFDARGEPLDWVYVEAASTSPNDVGLRLRQDLLHHANMVPTNESGEYRLAVQPGKYLVQASQTSRDDILPDGTLEVVFYNRTAHPGTVEAHAGQESAGIDIRMSRRPALRMAGVVTSSAGWRPDDTRSMPWTLGSGDCSTPPPSSAISKGPRVLKLAKVRTPRAI